MLNRTNFNVIKEIQNKADIVAVIAHYIKLTRKGNNYVGLCPFHPDKNPSLVVSSQKKIFKCFVCNAKGNVFGFVQQYQKIPYLEAIKIVAELIGFDTTKLNLRTNNTYLDPVIKRLTDLNKQVNEWFQGFLYNPENKDKLTYLHQRNLNNEIIKKFQLGFAPKDKDLIYRMASNTNEMFGQNRSKDLIWNEKELLDAGLITVSSDGKIFDFFNDRITIPIYDNNGYLTGFSARTITNNEPKYLNTSTTKLFSKANILFNFHRAKAIEPEKIIIVEGFMDVIAYARIGLENVVAIMGVALSDEHLNALHTLTKLNTVILSFDNDTAGVQATVDNGRKLMENGFNVYVVANYPKAYKDVDELLNESGDAALQAILDNRVDFITFLIENEFINKKPLDEIQKSVNGIIHDMLEFGQNSLLLRQQHLKLLADKSHLAFDDLKIKYDQDFDNFLNGSGKKKDIKCSQKPYKPTNDIGLNQSFVESENVDLKEDESVQNYNAIQVLQSELKTKENRLTEAFDRLILTVINCPSGFAKVEAEINLLTVQFPLVQQKFIFKALQYLFGRNELINEQSLANVLKEQSKAKNSVAVNYQSAYEYFMSKIDDQLYQIYHKEKLCHKSEERIKTLIKSIQLLKYEISIGETTIDIWKLKKENLDENSTKIKQLNVQLIETKKLFNSWKKKK